MSVERNVSVMNLPAGKFHDNVLGAGFSLCLSSFNLIEDRESRDADISADESILSQLVQGMVYRRDGCGLALCAGDCNQLCFLYLR